MPASPALLLPVLALALWTHAIMVWMYILRLPAMRAVHMKPDSNAPRGAQMSTLPPHVRWKSDNYTNLLEQPTVFYAVAIVAALLDQGGAVNVALAWTYVGLRVAHSLVQTLGNKVEVRFVAFALGSIVLFGLTANAAIAVI